MPAVPRTLRHCAPLLAQVSEQHRAVAPKLCVSPKLHWICAEPTFAEPLVFSSSSPHKQEYLCFGGSGAQVSSLLQPSLCSLAWGP